ncbi:chromate transporter [Entomospira nematocerorum]|uniref:Chromate transporter n=1 Tax=Entomospira nematocerorum TaxID=2719987 RepID=A0A968GFX8_9SPIO|nr:chromate transporter [Entomospira nematocera]NIZ46431.1 chromate transporter [Entomospira nematocera]WDI33766.1 chromate transporter [Entomospira nematocera]
MIYLQLAWTFFFIGAISFGGGFAMLPLLERMLVDDWISQRQFLDILAISQATPGAFAINAATYVGAIAVSSSLLGSSIATMTLSMPGFLLSYYVAYPMLKAKEHPYIDILMKYLAPTTLGLISFAGLNLFLNELTAIPSFHSIDLRSGLFMILSAIILRFKLMKSITLIFTMALLGLVLYLF